MTPAVKAEQPQLGLSVDERRARAARVRELADRELAQIENAIADALARLPALLALVRETRAVIVENTSPVRAGGKDGGDE